MAGGWETYRCDRCPLTIELGGSTLRDEAGVVYSKTAQVACRACGTMHRVTEDRGECRVTALPGPVRVARTETRPDGWGGTYEAVYWVAEGDWQAVGPFAGGMAAAAELPCRQCGRAAGMQALDGFKLPFHVATAGGRPECLVCRGPMECVGVSDAI
jgi:hypothetical protein